MQNTDTECVILGVVIGCGLTLLIRWWLGSLRGRPDGLLDLGDKSNDEF